MSKQLTPTGAERVVASLSAATDMPFSLRLVLRYTGWILAAYVLLISLLPGDPQPHQQLYAWLAGYLAYQGTTLLWSVIGPRSYESLWSRVARIQLNILFISLLIYLVPEAHGHFWFAYLLPILAATLYVNNTVALVALVVETEVAYFLATLAALGPSGSVDWSLLILDSTALLLLSGVLYYLLSTLRVRYSLGLFGVFQRMKTQLDTVYDPQSLNQIIVKQAVQATRASAGCLLLVERHTGSLVLAARTPDGPASQVAGSHLEGFTTLCRSIAGWVAKEERPFRTSDITGEQILKLKEAPGMLSVLSVPIVTRGRSLGVLSVGHERRNAFGKEEQNLLQAFGMDAAEALERVRLLSSLEKVSGALSSTRELEKAGGVILDELGRIVDYCKATLQLIRYDERELIAYRGFSEQIIDDWLLRPISQDPLIRHIAETGETLILAEPLKHPDWETRPATADVASWIGVPLFSNGRMIGLLTLDHDRPGYYANADQDLLTLFGNQAAIALRNFETLEELRFLYETSVEITRELDLETLLRRVVQRATELLHARGGGFYECDYESEQVRISVVHGISQDIVGQTLRFGEGMAGRVVLDGQSQKVVNYQEWPHAAKAYTEGQWKGLFEAVIESPVMWQERVIGVLFVVDQERSFTENDIRLLERFANQAAIALNNASILGRMRDIVDTAFDAIVQVDENGLIEHCNPSARKTTGYREEEMLGTPARRLYCEGYKEAARIQWLLEQQGKVKDRQSCVRHKDGQEIEILFSGALLRDHAGHHIGSVGFFKDIGEIRALRVISNASRSAFRAIRRMGRPEELSALLQIIVKETAKLFDADAAAILLREDTDLVCRAYGGYVPQEMEGLSVRIGRGLLGSAVEQGQPVAVADVTQDPRYVEISADVRSELDVPIIADTDPIGVLHVASHRAGRFRPNDQHSLELAQILANFSAVAIQRAEAVRQQRETQERLLRSAGAVAAGRLAAGVGHEIKNSLNNIALTIGNVGDYIERVQGLSQQKAMLSKIETLENELRQLAGIATRLHQLSVEWEPAKEWIYVNKVVSNSIELLSTNIARHGCTYKLDLDPALDRPSRGSGGNPVHLDQQQIQQVIVNMTLNALDASTSGQRIDYRTRWHPSRQMAEIQIQDYGSGIDQETKRSIFKPFFSTKPDGTGLGLYVCDLIVRDKHKGRIEFVTKPGRGTTFSILLPAGEQQDKPSRGRQQ